MLLQSLLESFKEFRLNYNMNKKIYSLSELMNELGTVEGILGTSSMMLIWLKILFLNLSRKAMVRRRRRRRTSPSKMVNKLPKELLTKERKSKESVSIVVRKDIGRGIVQNLELPIIRVRKLHSSLKYV